MLNIADFLSERRSLSTRNTYKIALNKYFKYKQITPEQYFVQGKTIQNYSHDLIIYARWLEETKKMTPKTINTYLGALVSYFLRNDIELPRRFWKDLQIGSYAVTEDGIITKDILKQILTHTDCMGKAMFLLASSSGMRIEDILNITVTHIQKALQNNPAKLTIVQQKTRQKQSVFFSREAVESVTEWLKVREEWLTKAIRHCDAQNFVTKNPTDNRLFPCHYSHAVYSWNKALEASGYKILDENTNRHIYHIHSLRKFFRSQCTVAGVEPNVAEYFLGHIQGRKEYHQYTEDYLVKQYKMVEEKLRILVEPVTDPATITEINTLRTRLEAQADIIRRLNEGMRNLALTHQDPMVRKLWEGQLGQ